MNDEIRIAHVDKFYGKKQALKDVSLVIPQGMFGLLGRNGAGKTTYEDIGSASYEKIRRDQHMRRSGRRYRENPGNDRLSAAGFFHVSQYERI